MIFARDKSGQGSLTNMGIRQMWSDGLSKGHNVRKGAFSKGSCKDPKRYPLMISTNTLPAKYVKVILLMQQLLSNVYIHVSVVLCVLIYMFVNKILSFNINVGIFRKSCFEIDSTICKLAFIGWIMVNVLLDIKPV